MRMSYLKFIVKRRKKEDQSDCGHCEATNSRVHRDWYQKDKTSSLVREVLKNMVLKSFFTTHWCATGCVNENMHNHAID